jgi:hypothetical protein
MAGLAFNLVVRPPQRKVGHTMVELLLSLESLAPQDGKKDQDP